MCRFVAVTTMDIEFERLDMNQCPLAEGNPAPNYFAGTARCRPTTMVRLQARPPGFFLLSVVLCVCSSLLVCVSSLDCNHSTQWVDQIFFSLSVSLVTTMVRLLARPPSFLSLKRCFLCLLVHFVVWVACLRQFVITIPSEWIRFLKKKKPLSGKVGISL